MERADVLCARGVQLKVLMLTCQYMPDVYGGAEKQCRRLAGALHRLGAEVTILTSTQQRRVDDYDDEGLRVERIYTGYPPDLLGRWSLFSVYWLLKVLLWGWANRRSYDVVHCHQGKFGGFVGALLGRLVGKPVLIKIGNSEDDMDLLCLQRKALWGPICFGYLKSVQPKMVAISSVIARNLREAGFDNIVCIPNGVDRGLCNSASAKTPECVAKDQVHLFYHGRIEAIKRVDLLVKAFAELADPRAKLHLFGDGRELAGIKELAQTLEVTEHVEFHGAVDDVIDRIAALDVFVNTSRAEGFSNSLLEALLLEKVLMSTQVSGAEEAITPGVNGFIAEGEEPRQIAEAMRKSIDLCTTRRDSARQECRRKVAEVFEMGLIAKQYVRLYEELT